MAATFEPIATTAVSGTSVTLSNIPQTYTDLILVYNGEYNASDNAWMYFNGVQGTSYSLTYMQGNGSSNYGGRFSNFSSFLFSTVTAQTQRPLVAHIMNYADTTKDKVTLIRSNDSSYGTALQVGCFRSNNAITSITIATQGYSSLGTGTMSLYGIKAA